MKLRNSEGRNIKLTGMQSYCFVFIKNNPNCTVTEIYENNDCNYTIDRFSFENWFKVLEVLKLVKSKNGYYNLN